MTPKTLHKRATLRLRSATGGPKRFLSGVKGLFAKAFLPRTALMRKPKPFDLRKRIMLLKKIKYLLCFIFLGLFISQLAKAEYLTADEAFQLTVKASNGHQLLAHWNIAPGHYLYKDKFKITAEAPSIDVA